MRSRLQRIEIRNFKAFREFNLDLQGRHLLIYGQNGSGKSSLYWALYTFLQSAQKTRDGVAKYFDSSKEENLLNFDEQRENAPKQGEIALTLHDTKTATDSTYRISQTLHETHQNTTILDGDLASDFITYRFLFGFAHFRNSSVFNVWALFKDEILPFCRTTSGSSLLQMWHLISSGNPNPYEMKGRGGSYAYETFRNHTLNFAKALEEVVDSISREAQKFYDEHFSQGDAKKITLKLGLVSPPSFTGRNQKAAKFKVPEIEFGIQTDGKNVPRPQSFLNEAKLTQLALSVRFAASLVNLRDSDLKLLVLDDLLVSLDMSNRMKVVEILLSDTFANYQKIILTHDLGFFQEFRRTIGTSSPDWAFYRLLNSTTVQPCKSELETAQEYLQNEQIAECGNTLRKHVEEILTTFLERAKTKKGLDHLIDREKFASLGQKLNEASSELTLDCFKEFARILQAQFSLEELRQLASPDELDRAKFPATTKEEKKAKGELIAKLHAARSDLHRVIVELLSDGSRKRFATTKLLDEVRKIKDRILNPASHAGTTPLYSKEAEDAIKVIHALDAALSTALTTL